MGRAFMELVVPARNEERRIGPMLTTLDLWLKQSERLDRIDVLVVDNASQDDTAAVALRHSTDHLQVRVRKCRVPGKGAAVRTGILETDSSVVGFLDADGATHPDALATALELLDGGADLVIGSRALPGGEYVGRHTRVRELGAAAYRRAAAGLAPGFADTQCGFKIMRGDVGRDLFRDLRTPGFAFDVELLALAKRRGVRVVEFPVDWTDIPGSTFVPIRHGWRAFAELARIGVRLRRSDAQRRGTP